MQLYIIKISNFKIFELPPDLSGGENVFLYKALAELFQDNLNPNRIINSSYSS